jgi:amino acid transporter
VLLSILNVLGLREGKWTQNLLTFLKIGGLAILFFVAFFTPVPPPGLFQISSHSGSFSLALIFVLFAYGGWNEISFVAAEIKNPEKNIFKSLILGTTLVTIVYLMTTVAFLVGLGFSGLQENPEPAAKILGLVFHEKGRVLISTLIAISSLGAINGMVLTGARNFYAMGAEHKMFSLIGRWSPRFGTPVWALIIECVITVCLILLFSGNQKGFESMVIYTTPLFWLFMFLIAISVFLLRKDPSRSTQQRKVPFYPITPLLFAGTCLFMLLASIKYAYENLSLEVVWSLVVFLMGYLLHRINQSSYPRR